MEEEVILNKIIQDAKQEASKIIGEAKERAEKITAENQKKASKEAQDQFEVIKTRINFSTIFSCLVYLII